MYFIFHWKLSRFFFQFIYFSIFLSSIKSIDFMLNFTFSVFIKLSLSDSLWLRGNGFWISIYLSVVFVNDSEHNNWYEVASLVWDVGGGWIVGVGKEG